MKPSLAVNRVKLTEPRHGRPKKIHVFENGDRLINCYTILINPNALKTWLHILAYLTDKIRPSFGCIRYLVSLDTMLYVNCFDDLEQDKKYVALGGNSAFMKMKYLTPDEVKRRKRCPLKPYYTGEIEETKKQFYRETKKRGLTIIYAVLNGSTCQEPKKFVLNRYDKANWSNTLMYMKEQLNVDGIKYLTTIFGDVIKDPCQLQHGYLYVAVAYDQQFVNMDYVNLFDGWNSPSAFKLRIMPAVNKLQHRPLMKEVGGHASSTIPEAEEEEELPLCRTEENCMMIDSKKTFSQQSTTNPKAELEDELYPVSQLSRQSISSDNNGSSKGRVIYHGGECELQCDTCTEETKECLGMCVSKEALAASLKASVRWKLENAERERASKDPSTRTKSSIFESNSNQVMKICCEEKMLEVAETYFHETARDFFPKIDGNCDAICNDPRTHYFCCPKCKAKRKLKDKTLDKVISLALLSNEDNDTVSPPLRKEKSQANVESCSKSPVGTSVQCNEYCPHFKKSGVFCVLCECSKEASTAEQNEFQVLYETKGNYFAPSVLSAVASDAPNNSQLQLNSIGQSEALNGEGSNCIVMNENDQPNRGARRKSSLTSKAKTSALSRQETFSTTARDRRNSVRSGRSNTIPRRKTSGTPSGQQIAKKSPEKGQLGSSQHQRSEATVSGPSNPRNSDKATEKQTCNSDCQYVEQQGNVCLDCKCLSEGPKMLLVGGPGVPQSSVSLGRSQLRKGSEFKELNVSSPSETEEVTIELSLQADDSNSTQGQRTSLAGSSSVQQASNTSLEKSPLTLSDQSNTLEATIEESDTSREKSETTDSATLEPSKCSEVCEYMKEHGVRCTDSKYTSKKPISFYSITTEEKIVEVNLEEIPTEFRSIDEQTQVGRTYILNIKEEAITIAERSLKTIVEDESMDCMVEDEQTSSEQADAPTEVNGSAELELSKVSADKREIETVDAETATQASEDSDLEVKERQQIDAETVMEEIGDSDLELKEHQQVDAETAMKRSRDSDLEQVDAETAMQEIGASGVEHKEIQQDDSNRKQHCSFNREDRYYREIRVKNRMAIHFYGCSGKKHSVRTSLDKTYKRSESSASSISECCSTPDSDRTPSDGALSRCQCCGCKNNKCTCCCVRSRSSKTPYKVNKHRSRQRNSEVASEEVPLPASSDPDHVA